MTMHYMHVTNFSSSSQGGTDSQRIDVKLMMLEAQDAEPCWMYKGRARENARVRERVREKSFVEGTRPKQSNPYQVK